jgi:hypothetical protein
MSAFTPLLKNLLNSTNSEKVVVVVVVVVVVIIIIIVIQFHLSFSFINVLV